MSTSVYNTPSKALVTFPEDAGVVLVNLPGFRQRLDGPILNRYTFQFTGGGGGATMAIEAQGPTGAFSPYVNAAGDAATAVAEDEAYIVDTGLWTAFRCTFAGSDGSAVLSVMGWQATDTVSSLTQRIAALETDVAALEAETVTLQGEIDATNARNMVWRSETLTQTLTGATVGTAAQIAFDEVVVVIEGGTLQDGDEVLINAAWRCVSVGGATNYQPRLHMNVGPATNPSGAQIASISTNVPMNTANNGFIDCTLVVQATGASGAVDVQGLFFANSLQAVSNAGTFAFAVDTTADLYFVPTLQFNGGTPNASDAIEWRNLTLSLKRRTP